LEIEAKYTLQEEDNLRVEDLAQLFKQAGYQVQVDLEVHQIQDLYFDDAERSLARVDAAIRLRRKGGRLKLTFKRKVAQEGAIHSRIELEATPDRRHLEAIRAALLDAGLEPASLPDADQPWPAPEALLAAWGFSPKLEIDTQRQTCNLSLSGEDLAEATVDRVRFQIGGQESFLTAVEIEALDEEQAKALAEITRHFEAALGARAQREPRAKVEIGLQRLGADYRT